MIKKIDASLVERCLAEARQSPRKRSHFNLHENLEAPVQRLCIALTQGTYVRPHHHPQPNKWELLVAIKGESHLILFNDDGGIREALVLSPSGPLTAVEIAPNTWHSVLPKDSESVILELKEGPYIPHKPEYFPSWAPEEGSEEAKTFLTDLQRKLS